MLIFAGIIDAFQFFLNMIPLAGIFNPLISIIGILIFWIWFKSRGVSLFHGKAAKITFIVIIFEILPFIDSFSPGFFVLVKKVLNIAKASENEV